MPQRQAITMIIIYYSKSQQTDAVTPTPLAHRSYTCMRALALGHDTFLLSQSHMQSSVLIRQSGHTVHVVN